MAALFLVIYLGLRLLGAACRFGDSEETRKSAAEGTAERHAAEMFSVNCTLAEMLLQGADVIDLLHLLELRDWLAATAAAQQQQQQQQQGIEETNRAAVASESSNAGRKSRAYAATAAPAVSAGRVSPLPGLVAAPAFLPPPAALVSLLEGISCRRVQALLIHGGLLQQPHLRLSAQQTLLLWLQHVFPPSFGNYFLCLFTILLHPAYQQADMRLLLLKEHLPDLILALLEQRPAQQQQQQQQQPSEDQRQRQRQEGEAQELLLQQLLREAAARETLDVDACIAHQVSPHLHSFSPIHRLTFIAYYLSG